MNHLDCPLCSGHATIDDDLSTVQCDGCGIRVDIAPDPAPVVAMGHRLDEAA